MDPATSTWLTYAAFAIAGLAIRHFFPGLFPASPPAAPRVPASPGVPAGPGVPVVVPIAPAPVDFGARLMALEQLIARLFQQAQAAQQAAAPSVPVVPVVVPLAPVRTPL